jgi:hypothetical protein
MTIPHKHLPAYALSIVVAALAAPSAVAAAPVAPAGFTVSTFATAPTTTPATTGADDIAKLDGNVYVGWQNGAGTKGEPNSGTGQTDGTLVEYDPNGDVLASWKLTGKIDGLGGDPERHEVIATVNEDGNSSLYTIQPDASPAKQVRHYTYSPAPDSAMNGGVFTGGGTDAVVVHKGHIFISASNPAVANATTVFVARLHPGSGVASLAATFADNATATDAVSGESVNLALTDPDSNAYVPRSSARFGGQIVLDSQGDQQLVFARRLQSAVPELTRLALTSGGQTAGVDDIRWSTTSSGTLLVVDSKAGTIYAVTGPFAPGTAFASSDTLGAEEHTTEVEEIELFSGELTPFLTGLAKARGLVWLAPGSENENS